MNVVDAVLEKDKQELQLKLIQMDKERRIATQKETDLAKKVRCSAQYCVGLLCCIQ